MRVRLFVVLVSIAACVGVVAGCSTFTGDAGAGDAGDASAVDATNDVTKLPPTPGLIECFGATCSSAMSQSCCFDSDAGTTACASSCAPGVVAIRCDEKTDCAPGRICCVGVFGNADCQSTCNGERLCHSNDECDVGSSCVVLPCRGSVIGACGPVGPYVKAFCNGH